MGTMDPGMTAGMLVWMLVWALIVLGTLILIVLGIVRLWQTVRGDRGVEPGADPTTRQGHP